MSFIQSIIARCCPTTPQQPAVQAAQAVQAQAIPTAVFAIQQQPAVQAAPAAQVVQAQASQTVVVVREFVAFYKDTPSKGCDGESGYLGNFHICPNGIKYNIGGNSYTFRCSEAAFQAAKCYIFTQNPAHINAFTSVDGDGSIRLCRHLTSQVHAPDYWIKQGRNIQAMREILHAKFTQNPSLRQQLLSTGNAYLAEHNETAGRDKFWSDNYDGSGRNMLGELLMELRGLLGGRAVIARPTTYNDYLVYWGQQLFSTTTGAAGPAANPSSLRHRGTQAAGAAAQQSPTYEAYADPNQCKLPGCQKARYATQDFCGIRHGREYKTNNNGQEPCKLSTCGKPKYPSFDFCGRAHGQEFNR
ncbi:MAG: Riboflavin biosynthesis protein [Candidatus Anoxychlamydiales bacterium]|nr:Riboflavin biosynthesis protein [Candidatus Anoxychlamydiales bacterium]